MYYYDLLRYVSEKGSPCRPRGVLTKEARNLVLDIKAPKIASKSRGQMRLEEGCGNFICSKSCRPFEKVLAYELAELAWYMSLNRKTAKIEPYAKLWGKIQNEDKTANSNYGYLVFRQIGYHPSISWVDTMTGFNWALYQLEKDKDSREAVITYNNGSYNYKENKDYICTQCQMFLIRDNKLHCTVPLRSSDAIFGLTFNMPWWSFVQQQLRLRLLEKYPDLMLGDITVNIQSAHIYEQHFDLVKQMLKEGKEEYFIELKKRIVRGARFEWYQENLQDYLKITRIK